MPGVPDQAASILASQYSDLVFKGTISPEYGFEKDPAKLEMLLSQVAALKADILFLCLGEPKSGMLAKHYLDDFGVSFVFNVGAAVDFAAGNVDRAPKWMQDHSLEWFYRFMKEPKRLFRRYFVDSWHFLAMCRKHKG